MGERVEFSVNGKQRELDVRPDETAVEVIRDRLGLTGTKLVCGDGVCGACTVLLDGDPVVSCLLPATALQGRKVTTIESFGPDLHPVQRAFMAHDALQCGYCTPGFVVEAIAFHDRWRAERGTEEPAQEQVVEALAGHLCRCGAYVGIVAAVRDACAGRFDDGHAVAPRLEERGVSLELTDAAKELNEHVVGRGWPAADVRHEGQLEGAILRSPHPHARVLSVDLDPARALPGVAAAIELLGKERVVRYVGQEVAAVAATDIRTAHEALARVHVEYEPLPAAIGAQAARRSDAPALYRGLRKNPPNSAEGAPAPARWHGNVRGPASVFSQRPRRARRAIAEARDRGDPLLVEGRWQTAQQVHTPFEPHACAARWEGETLHIHLSTQSAARLAEEIAERYGVAVEQVHLVAEHVGGGFGAKQALTPEAVAATELARAAGAPVRVVLDRGEEMSVAGHRPAAEIELVLLAGKSDGPRAVRMSVHGDGGVSAGSGIALLARMIYPASAKDLQDYDVVNNMPPGLPFRGPGAPAACWALEQAVDEAAHRLGEDPVRLRRRWDPHAGRQRLYQWAQALPLWRDRPSTGSQQGRLRRGVGVAAANWLYLYQTDCEVEVGVEGGRLFAATSTQDIGTGSRSVVARTVAETFGVKPADVEVRIGDSRLARGPASGGSAVTATLVPTTLAAAAELRRRLIARAGPEWAGSEPDWAELLASAPDLAVRADRPEDSSTSGVGRPLEGTGPVGWLTVKMVRRQSKIGVGRGYTGAVHVTEVAPMANWLPAAGVQVTGGAGSRSSVAVAV